MESIEGPWPLLGAVLERASRDGEDLGDHGGCSMAGMIFKVAPHWGHALKAHKPDIVGALGQPPASKRRGLDGYGTPPGVPPLGDCALARQIRAMNRAASPAMLDDDPVPGNEPSAMPLPGLLQRFNQEKNFGGHRVVQIGSVGYGAVAAAGDDGLEGLDEAAKQKPWKSDGVV